MQSTQTVLSCGAEALHSRACAAVRDSWSVPRSPSTVTVLSPYPASTSSAASADGVRQSLDSSTSRAPGASARRTRSTDRPTTEMRDRALRRPAHPSAGQGDRGDSWVDPDPVGAELLDQRRPDPGQQRVPAGQHDRPRLRGQQLSQSSPQRMWQLRGPLDLVGRHEVQQSPSPDHH